MSATLRTTYFGGIGSVVEPDEDAEVLAVVRYPQDFVERVTDRNVPALAPPEELLDAYKTVEAAAERDDYPNPRGVAWESVDFERRYRDNLDAAGPREVLANVRERLHDHVDVWLVCWEKNPRYCHRRVLADVLVDEVDGVDVEHYPAPEEPERDEDTDDGPRPVSLADFNEGEPTA